MDRFPPADEVKQFLSVASDGKRSEAAEGEDVEISVHPIDLAAGGLLDDAEGAACGIGGRVVKHAKCHGMALSSSVRNWRASPPPVKKAVRVVVVRQNYQQRGDRMSGELLSQPSGSAWSAAVGIGIKRDIYGAWAAA